MTFTSILGLTQNQQLALGFTGVLLLIGLVVIVLIVKSLKDDRAYHGVDLPSLTDEDEEKEEEKSAFAIEEDFDLKQQDSFFSVDEDEPMFDFGADEQDIPNLMADEKAIKKSTRLKKARPAKAPKKSRKERLKASEKLAQDRKLVDEIIASTSPQALNPLNPITEDQSGYNEDLPYIPSLDEKYAVDESFVLPSVFDLPEEPSRPQEAPAMEEQYSDSLQYEETTQEPREEEPEVEEGYIDPNQFLAQRGINLEHLVASEEEDDDFTPEIVRESAFGSEGLHDFELQETSSLSPPSQNLTNIRIPSTEDQAPAYVGKRRKDVPVDFKDS